MVQLRCGTARSVVHVSHPTSMVPKVSCASLCNRTHLAVAEDILVPYFPLPLFLLKEEAWLFSVICMQIKIKVNLFFLPAYLFPTFLWIL